MAEVTELIRDIEREIEADKKALAEKEAGLRMLKARVAGAGAPAARVQTPVRQSESTELFDLTSLEIEDIPRRRTFVDDLKDAVRRFGPQEFSIAHVEAVLKRLGIEVAGKTPRSRISASLSKLWEEGVLVRTFEGGGNVPNRFRVKEFMSADELRMHDDGLRKKEDHVAASSASIDGADDNEV